MSEELPPSAVEEPVPPLPSATGGEAARQQRFASVSLVLGALGWVLLLLGLGSHATASATLVRTALAVGLAAVVAAVISDLPRDRARPLRLGARLGFGLGAALLSVGAVGWGFSHLIANLG